MNLKLFQFSILFSVLAAPTMVFAQAQPQPAPADTNQAQQMPLLQIDLENFEEGRGLGCPLYLSAWRNKDAEARSARRNPRDRRREHASAAGRGSLRGRKPRRSNHILGVKTYFDDRGFDRVEVKPPHEFVLKGKARQFSIWVLGRNYRHTMYVRVRDYRGKTHNIRLGRLDFFGWRKFTVAVPGWVPQSTRFSLLDKNLHFVSFFVTSDVHEVPGEFYFYVDGLKVLVDQSEQVYPGSEIKDNW